MSYRFLHRRDTVLIAAIDILDQGGIQGLTTKEIAKVEGVTEAAIYKHYSGKQEIVEEIIKKFASFDAQICNTIIEKNMSEAEGLTFYARAYAENYQWYPQIATLLFSFDVYRYTPELKAMMEETMENRRQFLVDFILRCRLTERGEHLIEASVLANLVLGCIFNSVYFWKLSGEGENLKDNILSGIETLLKLSTISECMATNGVQK